MNERGQNPELKTDYADLAYFHFVRLSNEFGKTPAVVKSSEMEKIREKEPKARKFTQDSKTFPAVAIPTQEEIPGTYNLISGINYGLGEINIYYETGDRAGTVAIGRDHDTNKVHIINAILYKRNFVNGHYVKEHLDKWEPEQADIKVITELLIRAEQILRRDKTPQLENLTRRERFFNKIEELITGETPSKTS